MKVYIASSLANAHSQAFKDLIEWVDSVGIEISFRWWEIDVDHDDPDALRVQAEHEVKAIRDSDAYVMVLPAKMGGHVELGIALGGYTHFQDQMPIAIWCPDGHKHAADYPCAFHYLDGIDRLSGDLSVIQGWLNLRDFEYWDWSGRHVILRQDDNCICGAPIDWTIMDTDAIPVEIKCTNCTTSWGEWYPFGEVKTLIVEHGASMEDVEAWFYANRNR